MISIIIASVNNDQLTDIKKNIAETIGVEHEIISFDNADGVRGLCEIYNEGAKLARYDMLCYMHEDINIKTEQWGNIVADTFKTDPNIGLIGVAGSSYKTMVPSGWFCDAGAKSVNYIHLLQRYKFNEKETKLVLENPKSQNFSKVVVVDGVWFCTKKELVKINQFDEEIFKRFHCYDLDFSLQISRTHQAVVTFEILLEHFSEGNYDKTWVEETIKLHNKWGYYLPINLGGLTKKEKFIAEKYSFRVFLKQMLFSGYSRYEIFKIFWNSSFRKQNFILFIKLIKEIKRTQIS